MNEVDAYINHFSGNTKKRLLTLRKLIKNEVPEAQEGIMYGLIGYKLYNKPLVYFGGFNHHIGFYATPQGHEQFAWGGKYRILPHNLRIGSVLSLFIYAGIIVCLLSKSDIIQLIPEGPFLNVMSWIIFAYFVLGILMNIVSRSKSERYLMTPVVVILAVCALMVAIA